jgi:hypothetical protein
MEFEDIYKYVGYFMVGLVVLWLGLKSLRFQYKCVGGVCSWLKPKKQNAPSGAGPLGPSGAGPSGAGPSRAVPSEAVPEARQTTTF